ncbi:uncharacterized protein LOC128641868 [Bombina bombina]|uniref:uncharacterized protein LOC128641868 n=1 Tax=Bombina bombina TaxID=8345 RepID=UPI00235ACC5D|nr:uncharacterized protein LOC128641868 [Bombina bombina]
MISKKERKTIPHTGKRLTIFCEAANIDIVFLIERMITDNIMKSCSSGRVVYFMDDRENEWKSVSIKSSVILFYGCMVANSLGDIAKSLEPIIKTYGTEHIIVVLGYANTTKSEKEIKAEWILSKSSCSKVICFTEQELDLISPSLKGPKTAARSMAYKVNYIRHILSKESQHLGMESVKTKKKQKPTVRIFSWSKRKHSEWLRQLLISKRFLDQEHEVRYIYVPSPVDKSLEEKISCCTNIILYITSAQLGFKPEFLHLLDRDKVIAVIDNLDDSNTETLIKIKQTYPHIQRMSQELILFSREEKSSNYENYRTSLILAEKTLQEKMIQLEDLIKDTAPIENERLEVILKEPCISVPSISHRSIENHTVGIFSRSGQNNYSWILTLLESENFSHIKEIKPHCITNNGYLKFREAVSQCTFGILYHTKNYGRVNVTNVTDSLYDEELKHLSDELGKEKVIVIIDDLEDSSSEEKNRILDYQPDIGNLAKELFIFSESEKTSYKLNPGDLLIDSSIGEKFLGIKDLLQ